MIVDETEAQEQTAPERYARTLGARMTLTSIIVCERRATATKRRAMRSGARRWTARVEGTNSITVGINLKKHEIHVQNRMEGRRGRVERTR